MAHRPPMSRTRLRVVITCWVVLIAVGLVQVGRGFRSGGDHFIGVIGVLQALAAVGMAIATLSEDRHRRRNATQTAGDVEE